MPTTDDTRPWCPKAHGPGGLNRTSNGDPSPGTRCLGPRCAWWDKGNRCCAVTTVPVLVLPRGTPLPDEPCEVTTDAGPDAGYVRAEPAALAVAEA